MKQYEKSMKSRFRPIVIFVILILTFVQCQKESPPVTNDSFIIGEYNSLYYTKQSFDPLLEVYAYSHSSDSLRIDINNDGLNDFELISNHPISPGGINYCYLVIKPLHSDIEISYIEIPDTIFKCISTSSGNDDSVVFTTTYN